MSNVFRSILTIRLRPYSQINIRFGRIFLPAFIISGIILQFASCASLRFSDAEMPEHSLSPEVYEAASRESEEASRYLVRNQYERALQHADRSLEIGETFEGHYIRGLILSRMDRSEQSIRSLLNAEQVSPDHEQLLLTLAMLFTSEGQYDQALSRYNRLNQLYPDQAVYPYRIGVTYKLQGQYEEALKYFEQADQDDFEHLDQVYMQTADTLVEMGRYGEAEEYFAAARIINPEIREAADGTAASRTAREIQEGQAAMEEGRFQDSLTHFENAAHYSPASASPLMMQGTAYIRMGDQDRAEEKWNQAIEVNPSAPESYVLLAAYLREQNEPAAARDLIQRGLEHSSRSMLFNQLGLSYSDLGDYSAAIDAFHQALREDEQNAAAARNLAFTYLEANRYDDAARAFETAQDLAPDDEALEGAGDLIVVYRGLNRGNRYFSAGQYDRALAEYRSILETKSDLPVIHNSIGRVQLARRNFRDAERAFQQSLRIEEDNIAALEGLLGVYNSQGRRRDASRIERSLQSMTGEDPAAALALGRLREEEMSLDEARRYYSDLMRKHPGHTGIERRLGRTYYRMGLVDNNNRRFRQALSNFENAKRYNADISRIDQTIETVRDNLAHERYVPRIEDAEKQFQERNFERAYNSFQDLYNVWPRPMFLVRMAEVRIRQGRHAEGRRILEDALASNPESLEVREAIFNQYIAEDDYDSALAGFRNIVEENSDAFYSHYKMGVVYLLKEEVEQAIESFDRSLIFRPDFTPSRLARGVAFYRDGKRERALEEFEKAREATRYSEVASLNVALMAFNDDRLDEAAEAFAELAEQHEDFPDPFYHMAFIEFERENYEKAEENMRRALAIKEEPDFYRGLLRILEERIEADSEPVLRARLRETYNEILEKFPGTDLALAARQGLSRVAPDERILQTFSALPSDATSVFAAGENLFVIRNRSISILRADSSEEQHFFRLSRPLQSHYFDNTLHIFDGEEVSIIESGGKVLSRFDVPDGVGANPSMIGAYNQIGISDHSATGEKRLRIFNADGQLLVSKSMDAGRFVYAGAFLHISENNQTITTLDSSLDEGRSLSLESPLASVFTAGNQIILRLEDGRIQIVNPGRMNVSGTISEEGQVVAGRNSLFLLNSSSIQVFDLNGKLQSEIDLVVPLQNAGSFIQGSDGYFYIGNDNKLHHIDEAGSSRWEMDIPSGASNFTVFY